MHFTLKRLWCIFFLCICVSKLPAQIQANDQNMVIILIDGYRWQELFHGAEWNLLNNPKFNSMDSLKRIHDFWSDDINNRREKLMPFTWKYIAKKGQLYGNRDLGNNVNVQNPYWFSYPGRAEALSGFVDTAINSNNYKDNENMNVLEFLNQQNNYHGKVAGIVCWVPAGKNLNKDKTTMMVNIPWEDVHGTQLTQEQILANELQHIAPRILGDGERLDFEVYALAKSYINANHPKVIYIDFGDTDEYAHEGAYDKYLEDIHHLDAMIEKLWLLIQADPFYKDKTSFIIFPDHGRGVGDAWTDHGSDVMHSNETWLATWGPAIKPLGEMKTKEQIFQTQYAATIAQLLGFKYNSLLHKVGKVLPQVAE
ncbi:MAG: phosphoglyceromutase [Bacteroidetes bacterium]|nr:phosphoglyceromutase [Bacteroidota bacterium]